MKNLLKGMLIGFIVGGILLAAAAFLFFRHPFRKNRKLRKYLPWSRPEKHPKKSPSRKNRTAPFWLLQEM